VAVPDNWRLLFAVSALEQCSGGIIAAVGRALYLSGLIGAVLVSCVALFELLWGWIRQVEDLSQNIPIAAGRVVLFVLLLAVLGERLAVYTLYR
jgi:hypothetical protein